MSNRLAHETSLYLRQHADNPVDWYPWGDEAFAVARQENRPVLISVGYSACHWCHVMAHESFEDPDTAALMNTLFVNVKVDREERPDVDALYMQATVALTGHGGWPMTVFTTPDGRPFFAGTYFPPEARGQMPAFSDICRGVAHAFRTQRDEVDRQCTVVMDRIMHTANRQAIADDPIDEEFLGRATAGLEERFDPVYGGFGGAPKFPPSTSLELLLHRQRRLPEDVASRLMSDLTLTRMSEGGICDHLAGGFHRYTVDGVWGVPHFEKMLFDNALLARVYAHAFAISGEPEWRRVAEQTLDFMTREMRLDNGAFAAAFDADTPDGEGAYFTWTPEEITAVLDDNHARVIIDHFGVRDEGQVDGRSVLAVARPLDAVADLTGLDAHTLYREALPRLLAERDKRVPPARDDKVIVAWNGFAVAAFADAGRLLHRDDYIGVASEVADFLWKVMWVDGRLRRTWQEGIARHDGQLDDHAALAHGLICLYEATFDERWLVHANDVVSVMLNLFSDDEGKGFYRSGHDGEKLAARTRDLEDHPTPSGSSLAALCCVRLGALMGDPALVERARYAIEGVSADALRFPHAFGTALLVMDLIAHHHRDNEVVIAAAPDDPGRDDLITVAREHGGVGVAILVTDGAGSISPRAAGCTTTNGTATAYVCRGQVCGAPVTTPDALRDALAASN